jgi:cation diffusion facilitator CzcD-associated flavoprotein CzcO
LRVETGAGSLEARRVVLALGSADQPLWPEWADALRAAGAPVRHVFEPAFRLDQAPAWPQTIVLGGGLSAVQLALWLAARRPGAVTLLSRHATRVQEFDSDARWMGPRGARAFARLAGTGDRRALIGRERHRGSVPSQFAREVDRQVRLGSLAAIRDDAVAAAPAGAGIEIELASGRRLRGDGLLLATGFHPRRPGGAWLDRTIDQLGLEYAACGYPVVDASLRWGPGLYVTGPLAELEIGPVARNILGARLAGERLVAVARG